MFIKIALLEVILKLLQCQSLLFRSQTGGVKGGSTRYRWPVPSSYTAATNYEKLNAHLTFFAV